jgi:hypothetical protein
MCFAIFPPPISPLLVSFITEHIRDIQYIEDREEVKTMEGIILEGLTVDISIAAFIFFGAVVTAVFLAWMNEEEKAGARLTWAGWPLPETEEPAPPEEKVRLAA